MNKVNAELIKLGQGKRLAQFRLSKGFRSRLAFAQELGISVTTINDVENNKRKISHNLLIQITQKWPDIDELYLSFGEKGVKAFEKVIDDFNLVKEIDDNELYKKECFDCKKKDAEIKALSDKYSKLLEDYNDCLREVLELRKASSG